MPGAQRTRSLVREEVEHTSKSTTVAPEITRHSRTRMVLTLIPRSPRRSGFFVTVTGSDSNKHPCQLDVSVETSGPRGFTSASTSRSSFDDAASTASRAQHS